MPWSWDEIRNTWLRDTVVDQPTSEVWVEHFDIVERYMGRDWMDQARFVNGVETWGLEPALFVITQGARLACLDRIRDTDRLIQKLLQHDSSAWAELTAIWLLQSGDQGIDIELEPQVPGWSRVPDFRARRDDDWTYVEVSQPTMSEIHARLREITSRLVGLLDTVTGRYALEIFLRREPTEAELDYITKRLPPICALVGRQVEELPNGLGTLYLNETEPGRIELRDHGDDYRPRLGQSKAHIENGVAQRQINVRLAFSDERADAVLDAEAQQLPKTAPGLVMLQTSGATGAFKLWEPMLRKRLQPKLHTRVSAICLFESGMHPQETGVEWRPETKVLANENAALKLPQWITAQLIRFTPRGEAVS
jgi:hypothetical protein